MKRLAVALLPFVMGWQAQPAGAADAAKLESDTYSGYFVSNKFEPDQAASFAVIEDQKRSDEVFGAAAAKKSGSATFACPLIVSIPKGKYTAVQFVENKKSLKEIKLGAEPRDSGTKP